MLDTPYRPPQSEEWALDFHRRPARILPFTTIASLDQTLIRGRGLLLGCEAINPAGTTVRWQLLDGAGGDGPILNEFNSTTLTTVNPANLANGIIFRRGLLFHVVSGTGTLRGSLWVVLPERP